MAFQWPCRATAFRVQSNDTTTMLKTSIASCAKFELLFRHKGNPIAFVKKSPSLQASKPPGTPSSAGQPVRPPCFDLKVGHPNEICKNRRWPCLLTHDMKPMANLKSLQAASRSWPWNVQRCPHVGVWVLGLGVWSGSWVWLLRCWAWPV